MVGIVLGLDLTNRGWTAVGDSLMPGVDVGFRPLAIAVLSLAVIGGVIGLIGGLRAPGGSAVGGLFVGAFTGIVLGVLTAVALGPRVGAAFGVLDDLHRLARAHGPRRLPDRDRRRRHQGPLLPEHDHRDHEGDDRVGAPTDAARTEVLAARDEVLAARQGLEGEVVRLEASARAAVDIPARLRREPAKVLGAAGGAAFLLLGGPKRLFRRARRAVLGPDADLPKSMLPDEVEKTLKKLGPGRRPGPRHARARVREVPRRRPRPSDATATSSGSRRGSCPTS